MSFKRFTEYLLTHRNIAVLLTFVFTFVPVLGVLGILFAALVTLRKGILEGALITAAATLPYVISFMFVNHDPDTLPIVLWTAVGVAVLSNVLTWVFAVLLYRKMSWGNILQIAALVGVLAISVLHLAVPNIADWWSHQLTTYYTQAEQVVADVLQNGAAAPTDAQLESIKVTKYYANGMIAAAILLNALLQMAVARWWQAVLFAPGMLRKELHHIRLSKLAGVLFVASLVFSYTQNYVALDIMPIVYMLFAAAGLSVLHYFFGLMVSPTRWFWIAVMYVTLIFTMPASVVFVSTLALVDVWFDLRNRFNKSISS